MTERGCRLDQGGGANHRQGPRTRSGPADAPPGGLLLRRSEVRYLVGLATNIEFSEAAVTALYEASRGDSGRARELLRRLRTARRAPASAVAHVFQREGDYSTIVHTGRVVHLGGTKGLRYLARLLHKPGEPVHVAELTGATGTGDAAAGTLWFTGGSHHADCVNRNLPLAGREEPESTRTRGSATTATQPLPAPAADDGCVFRQEGEYWTLAYRGRMARLRHTKGLLYIARLLEQPGCAVHVRDLAAGPDDGAPNGSEPSCPEGDLGTVLDARATAQYRRRRAEARQELEEATAAGDLGRAARARHEVEVIGEQLAAAYGLGGRPRRMGDPSERVRKAVTNQIRRVLDRIRAAHPELGRHLTNALRTGFVCAYYPEHPVTWRL